MFICSDSKYFQSSNINILLSGIIYDWVHPRHVFLTFDLWSFIQIEGICIYHPVLSCLPQCVCVCVCPLHHVLPGVMLLWPMRRWMIEGRLLKCQADLISSRPLKIEFILKVLLRLLLTNNCNASLIYTTRRKLNVAFKLSKRYWSFLKCPFLIGNDATYRYVNFVECNANDLENLKLLLVWLVSLLAINPC